MKTRSIIINQPTSSILFRTSEAQVKLAEFVSSVLEQKTNKDESLAALTDVIAQLENVKRAIEGEGKEQNRGCSVMCYSGAVSAIPQ